MIDTLVISGASSKVISFIGIFKALTDHKIYDIDKIKELHTLSIGTLYSYSILFKLDHSLIYECLAQTDYSHLVNPDEIDFDNIVNTLGFFSNIRFFEVIVKNMCQYRFKKDDITLKELYEYNPIKLYVKCVNVNTKQSVHFNKDDHPDISLTKLLIMTTCIPLFFKPVEYKNNYYVDGGLTGNLPIELVKSSNILCIKISETKKDERNNYIKDTEYPILTYLMNLLTCSSVNYEKYSSKMIDVVINIPTHDFNISDDQKIYMTSESYRQTIERLKDKRFDYNILDREN